MRKGSIKKLLDYIPLVILTIYAGYVIWIRIDENILLSWRHWVGLLLLPVNYLIFAKNHQLGVLMLGLILLIGLLGITQYSPGVSIASAWVSFFGVKIPIFYGRPIFLLWLTLYFIISGKYYIAILTRKYWIELFT